MSDESQLNQEDQPSEKLAEIFAKMNMAELPAMSHNVQELISLTCSSRSAGSELTRVILKDYSLTNKVLQVVNSAYYSLGRPVNSISRAVTILGFDAMRDLATGIALFEEFIKSGVEKDSISMLLTRSFLSALQARDLAVSKGIQVAPEEAFICTLLHNLGRIIVCLYLPDLYREVEGMIEDGMSEDKACKEVMDGLTFHEIGREVAKFWNLAEKVVLAMEPKPNEPKSKYDNDAYLQNIACFSNGLVEKVCDGSDLGPLLDTYGDMFSTDAEELVENLNECVESSEDVSDSIRYGLSKLKIRSRLKTAGHNVKRGVFTSADMNEKKSAKKPVGTATVVEGAVKRGAVKGEATVAPKVEELNELPISTDKSVNDFIREITETLMGPFDLNDFYASLLEGLYRGVGFDRVILAIVTVQPTKIALVGRFGLGDVDRKAVKQFEHVLAKGQYAIPNSLRLCKDMMIPANKPNAFPEHLQYLVKDRNVYLFPVCLDKKGIGLIYLDRKQGRPLLDKSRIKTVRLFRDFAVMAIRKIRGGK